MTEHFLYVVLILLLIPATVTDLKERLIYDRFVLIGIVVAVSFRLFVRTEPWWHYVVTGLGVFLVLLIVAAATNERSIGGGDVKLFGMLGLALGWHPFLLLFLTSHILAFLYMLVVKLIQWDAVHWRSEFPFAPFILLGLIFTYSFLFFL